MANYQVINLIRSQLLSFHQLSLAVGEAVPHSALKGKFREIFVQNILTPYLPPSVELLSGTILFPNGESREFRNEDDVVIYDHNRSPLLLKSIGRESIMPSTGVRMHIEVKSNLRVQDIQDAVNASAEIIKNTTVGELPIGAIFAFKSSIGHDKNIIDILLECIQKSGYKPNSRQTSSPIQCICIANRGCWVLGNIPERGEGWYFTSTEDDKNLLSFISVVSNTIYANGMGIGAYILDMKTLVGPDPPMSQLMQ